MLCQAETTASNYLAAGQLSISRHPVEDQALCCMMVECSQVSSISSSLIRCCNYTCLYSFITAHLDYCPLALLWLDASTVGLPWPYSAVTSSQLCAKLHVRVPALPSCLSANRIKNCLQTYLHGLCRVLRVAYCSLSLCSVAKGGALSVSACPHDYHAKPHFCCCWARWCGLASHCFLGCFCPGPPSE